MKLKLLLAPCLLLALLSGCKEPLEVYDDMQGIIINEVSPCPSMGKEGWIELYNKSDRSINLKGLQVILTDSLVTEKLVATLKEGAIDSKGRFVISTKQVDFDATFLRANFMEIAVADAESSILNSFSVKYDLSSGRHPTDGESYARVPDASNDWTITNAPTPGELNYKIVSYSISNVIVNEVCPEGKWVELVNTGNREMHLDFATLQKTNQTVLYTFPLGTTVKPQERVVAELSEEIPSVFDFRDNSGSKLLTFSSAKLNAPAPGGSWSRLPDITGDFNVSTSATKGTVNESLKSSDQGIVINEVSLAGWVEISNSALDKINSKGIILKSGSSKIYESGAKSIAAGEKIVVNTTVTAASEFTLTSADGTVLSTFKSSDVKKDSRVATTSTSWSRLPDGTGKFYTVVTPTKGAKNYGIEAGNSVGIWVNHSSMNSISLEEMCRKGIGNILIHEFVFRSDKHNISETTAFLSKAHSLGMKVHIWMQCFKWNDTNWVRPVNEDGSWNQTEFDDIINRGLPYLNYDIDGIHFDYIRFSGSGTNKASSWKNGTEGITEFCRQANVKMKAKKPDLLLSAALMGEANCVSYYGQDPAKMAQYIDILMPMAYISSFNYSDSRNIEVANWFADRKGNSQCWHGLSTYNSSTVGLSSEQIYHDCYNVKSSRIDGIVLFRYGLGDLPDLTGMYSK